MYLKTQLKHSNIFYLDKQINDKILNSSQNLKYQNLILRVPKKEF